MNAKIKDNLFCIFISYFMVYSITFGLFSSGEFIFATINSVIFFIIAFWATKVIYKKIIIDKGRRPVAYLISLLPFLIAIYLTIFTIYSFNRALSTKPIPSLNWLSYFNLYAIIIVTIVFVFLHFLINLFYSMKKGKSFKNAIRESTFLFTFYFLQIIATIILIYMELAVYIILTF